MIATTIEQSKHLLELGLDPKSADMCWVKDYTGQWVLITDTQINVRSRLEGMYEYSAFQWQEHIAITPAWSLSALLAVMPKIIVHDMNKHVLCLKYAEGVAPFVYYVIESGRNKGKLIRFDNGRCVPDAYDALDAAYQMVCWLLEQGLINKGDNDESNS